MTHINTINKYPIISIITPSLNQGRFIEDTIESVLSGEGDFYLDYIIIDGGSTDNSVEIIKKYDRLIKEKQYPLRCKGIEYRWISEPDRGQSDAINKGFRMAKGQIIAFLNSDDLYTPGTIKNVVNQFLENSRIKLVYGDGFDIDEFNKDRKLDACRNKFNLKKFKKGDTVNQPSVFMRKEIIDTVGLLNINLQFSMDYEWFVRIAHKYKGKYIPQALSCSRRHPSSKGGDPLLPDLRASHLAIVRKYGGKRNFAMALGFDILRFVKYKRLTHKESFDMFKQAIIKTIKLVDSSITEKIFLDGYAYFFLLDALIYSSKDKKRTLNDIVFVLRQSPTLLLSLEGLLIFVKLILPERIYLSLKGLIKTRSIN